MGKSAKKPITDREFVLVEADNWAALYVDGTAVEQHHDVDLVDWLKKYGLNIRREEAYSDPAVYEAGEFPAKLRDVKLDGR